MTSYRILATTITSLAAIAATSGAHAADQFTFPSASGALIEASAMQSARPSAGGVNDSVASLPAPDLAAQTSMSGAASATHLPPPPVGSPDYRNRFPHGGNADASSYGFLTRSLAYQALANYTADYYRIFAPGYAVSTWTDRVAGVVDVGYGDAVDGWTAGAYYLDRLHGPSRRRETAPDLSLMPTFRPHPELEQEPRFLNLGH